jgi:hypothetical protein
VRLIEIAHFIGVVRSLVSYVLQLSIVRQIYMSRCFTSHAGLRLKLANLIELIQRFVCPRWARVRGNEAKRAAATQISPQFARHYDRNASHGSTEEAFRVPPSDLSQSVEFNPRLLTNVQ